MELGPGIEAIVAVNLAAIKVAAEAKRRQQLERTAPTRELIFNEICAVVPITKEARKFRQHRRAAQMDATRCAN